MALPTAPRGAGPAGRRLWREVLQVYDLAEHELVLLRQAVAVLDFIARLQETLDEEGLTDSKGRKHWVIPELRSQRTQLAQLLVAIRIPADIGERTSGGGSPPTAGSAARAVDAPPRTQRRAIRGPYLVRGASS